MNIFITGATGYIGNILARRLADEGHIVHALCRSKNKSDLLVHKNIKVFEGNILDKKSIEKAVEGCRQVYHVAAFARVWAKDPKTFERINLTGTVNVLDAAKAAGVEKIVFTSTAGVLGPSYDSPVKEDTPREIGFFNEYERTKHEAEEEIRRRAASGDHIMIVNPPRVYGPGIQSESNAVTKLIDLYTRGKWRINPGNGRGTGSYTFVEDVVDGHILAMEKGRPGERYIIGGENASYTEFFNMVRKVSGKKYRLFKMPIPLMVFFARLQMLKTALTGRAPMITPAWVRKYLYNWSLSTEKAEKELGYTVTSLEEGVKRTVDWLNQTRIEE